MKRGRLACLALATALAAAAAHAQPTDPRPALARELVQASDTRAGVADMEAALADVLARPVFRRLRDDAAWGPEHPTWQAKFPAFRESYRELALRLAPDLQEALVVALADKLTTEDLEQLIALQAEPALADARALLRTLGLDTVTLVRVAAISRAPALYSLQEQKAVRERLAALSGRQKEMAEAQKRLEPALRALQKPQLLKYQAVMSSVLSETLKRVDADATGHPDAQTFLAWWRAELKDD